MEPIAINLREEAGIARKGEPVQLGIPLPRSAFFADQTKLFLSRQTSSSGLAFQHKITSQWPDGSVRWLLLTFVVDIEAGQTEVLILQSGQTSVAQQFREMEVRTWANGEIVVSTGSTRFNFLPGQPAWKTLPTRFSDADSDQLSVRHSLEFKDASGSVCSALSDTGWKIEEQGPLSVALELSGSWISQDNKKLADFRCRLTLWTQSDNAKLDVCLHNPQRARHVGGLWDLGDPGSVRFLALGLGIAAHHAERAWIQADDDEPVCESSPTRPLKLYQDSSGGDAWDCENHINAAGKPVPRFQGYRLFKHDDCTGEGLRAQPIVGLESPGCLVEAHLKNFWQNFPSSVENRNDAIYVGIFPEEVAEPYELQGGERKTHTIWLHYGNQPGQLDWVRRPLSPTLPSLHYQEADAFPWFQANASDGPLERLIQKVVEGRNSFFAKREIIDEYGWRNFGDIFADHETLYQNPGERPLISHYNNQYDPIYGFARQFARTGDSRWFELMDDLAAHVTDIDLYHTSLDRSDYNHGLFWHTDHYLPAHTATHRTFSRHNNTSSTPGQTGGGPAAEHCYTTGLLYHHYLTGSQSSKEAVLKLTEWMRTIHEGQGGLLEQLLALKKQDIPSAKALVRGENPTPYKYPFTRGTGNYLNALLDAWQLEPSSNWLTLAERVIRETIHPADDINQRDLLNVESGWSYLVLLNSISRYLWIKVTMDAIDDSYHFARRSFLSYVDWIYRNERPFLDNTGQLEFPNDTWTAQDIRKAMLLFQAADIAESKSAASYQQHANEWLEAITDRLIESSESHYARVLVILLQNHGPHHARLSTFPAPSGNLISSQPPKLTWFNLFTRVIKRLSRGISSFSPSKERAWLNARLDRS